MRDKLALGKYGEDLACGYLSKQGYKILARNFRTRFGEIDVVAEDRTALCFIEVKTRASDDFGEPYESITSFKMRKLHKMARAYLYTNRLEDVSVRFDMVSIKLDSGKPRIELFRNIIVA